MSFALTTRWNAARHYSGEAMLKEILALGIRHIELGYDLRMDLVPGVLEIVKRGEVVVDSLHNFCPIPMGAHRGHPELFTFADPERRVREGAIQHTTRTVRFAAEVGAQAVVIHAGHCHMHRMSEELFALYERGQQFSPAYEKIKLKVQLVREKQARRQVEYLYQCIEQMLPVLQETRVKLGIENLPTWESIPTESEMEELFRHFGSGLIGLWYDVGHGQIRENMGFINQERWLERLQPHLIGMHLHDVEPPAKDHLMPPRGRINFARLKRFATDNVLKVIEPAPLVPAEEIALGLKTLQTIWGDTPTSA